MIAIACALLVGVTAWLVIGRDDPAPAAAPRTAGPCGDDVPTRADGSAYTCAFAEDFDGTELDRDRWLVQDTSYSSMSSGHYDCFRDSPDNFAVGGGLLYLTARQVEEPFTCKSPNGDFESRSTAATVATRDRFAQTYGRFEIRARFPGTTAPGVHSAVWLYPNRDDYGTWPHSGEVDIAEWFSADHTKVYPSVHYNGEDARLSTGYHCEVATAGDRFHTYVLEWSATEMRFLYDGEECYRHSWTPSPPLVAPQPFDRPFYVVLTQVFGAGWNPVTAETPQQATLLIDWVRVWK